MNTTDIASAHFGYDPADGSVQSNSTSIGEWAVENVAHPLANSLIVDTFNGLSGTLSDINHYSTNPWKQDYYSVGDNSNLLNWAAQTAAETVGTMTKFVIVGKLAGESLRAAGAARNIGGTAGQLLRNESLVQIGSATAFTAIEKPKDGDTRLGNAAQTAFSFGVFEYGGAISRNLIAPAKYGVRFGAGAVAGSGVEAGSELARGQSLSAESIAKAGFTSGIAGAVLPKLQEWGVRTIDTGYKMIGVGVPIDRYMARNFSPAAEQSPALKRIVASNEWARVQDGADYSSALVGKNRIYLGKNEATPEKLGHELQAIQSSRAPQYESRYVEAAKLLGDDDRAYRVFRQIRRDQELDQIETQHEISAQLGLTTSNLHFDRIQANIGERLAFGNTTYEQVWQQDFKQFKTTNGKYRPSTEYGGIENATLEEKARFVAKTLQDENEIGVFAGGAVRDELLKKKPKDYDIATSASSERVNKIFTSLGFRAFPKGESFGVECVLVGTDQFEIATLRKDGEYKDGRRPETVEFGASLREDAARRDLTFNAMFKNPVTGEIFDFFGGRKDIENKIIRAVGDPNERFAEDRLRMLRVPRFAGRLDDFTVDSDLMTAIKKNAWMIPGTDKMKRVAPDRIREELKGMLSGTNPVRAMNLMMESGLMEHTMPDFMPMIGPKGKQDPTYHPEGDAWTHTMMVLNNLKGSKIELTLGALFHDIGKPETQKINPLTGRITNFGHDAKGAERTHNILHNLTFSNVETDAVTDLVRNHMRMHVVKEMRRPTLSRLLEQPNIMDLVALQEADALGTTAPDRAAKVRKDFILSEMQELRDAPPAQRIGADAIVNGDTLRALGFKPSAIFKPMLEAARDAQYDGRFDSPESGVKFIKDNFGDLSGFAVPEQLQMIAARTRQAELKLPETD